MPKPMQLETESLPDDILKINLSGRMDVAGTQAIDLKFTGHTANRRAVIVDMSDVAFLASIGMRTLMLAAKAVFARTPEAVRREAEKLVASLHTDVSRQNARVAEVAAAGGVAREYQIDVDPLRLEEQGLTLEMLMMAVQQAGRDTGAMSVERTGVETMLRATGFVRSEADVGNIVIRGSRTKGAGVRLGEIARVSVGGQFRQGLLADAGFRAGFAALAERGLSFDAWVFHTQLDEVTALAAAFPGATIILNHVGGILGVGPYHGRRHEVFQGWKANISDLAKCANVTCKR